MRKICVFTGTRAEYGLMRPLFAEIKADNMLKLQIVASGAHLSENFGFTYKEIEGDGFKIDQKINIGLASDAEQDIAEAMAGGLAGCCEAYAKLKPDIVIIPCDRFEAFAAATAAMISRIPIAHIGGGEATFGLIDEAIRHSITKMSHLHFTSAEEYRKRVIQLGESPDRVFNVGAIGLDNIKNLELLSRTSLEIELRFKFRPHNLLVTFHPETLSHKDISKNHFHNLLIALDGLKNTGLIFTKANADTGGRIINKMIDRYVARNRSKAVAFASLGSLKYLSTMRFVDAVVGNSSSGIVEAPSFKIGTVNIGNRQEGRVRASSVIDCEPTRRDIKEAFKKLYSVEFKKSLKDTINPFDSGGNAAHKIKTVLKNYNLNGILEKPFYDIG